MTGRVWCVAHGGQWHAVRDGQAYPPGTTQIETACYQIVNSPGEPHGRAPECPKRLAAIEDDGEIDF